jgi:hypothetical protein
VLGCRLPPVQMPSALAILIVVCYCYTSSRKIMHPELPHLGKMPCRQVQGSGPLCSSCQRATDSNPFRASVPPKHGESCYLQKGP